MTNIINLNAFRKKKARAGKEKQAEQNRVKFGRTKAEKKASEAEEDRARRSLDGHIAEDGGDEPA